ncbi:MAG TPA: helix-turn-helix domain-containing protein, partial [Humibacillus sp.]|nr:helix-turn-helix domain-containing protein [Humibacillus sp.]
ALLPERALAGDQPARRILVDRVYRPLNAAAQAPLLRTATAYLESGGSLEATARALFVHANTVRYRLGRISDLTGYDLATPREAWVVRIALALGRLAGEGRSAPALTPPPGDRARSTLGSKVRPYAVPPGRQPDLVPRGQLEDSSKGSSVTS